MMIEDEKLQNTAVFIVIKVFKCLSNPSKIGIVRMS